MAESEYQRLVREGVEEPDAVRRGGDIGWARTQLARGKRVRRAGWNGKGMWLTLVNADAYYRENFHGRMYELLPYVGMKTADDKFVPWLCSQTDFLAIDWEIAE